MLSPLGRGRRLGFTGLISLSSISMTVSLLLLRLGRRERSVVSPRNSLASALLAIEPRIRRDESRSRRGAISRVGSISTR